MQSNKPAVQSYAIYHNEKIYYYEQGANNGWKGSQNFPFSGMFGQTL